MCQHQCGFNYACTCTFLHSCGHHADVPGLVHDQEVVVLVYDGHSRALIAISCAVKFRAALGACIVPQSEHAKIAGWTTILSPFFPPSLYLSQTQANTHTHTHTQEQRASPASLAAGSLHFICHRAFGAVGSQGACRHKQTQGQSPHQHGCDSFE